MKSLQQLKCYIISIAFTVNWFNSFVILCKCLLGLSLTAARVATRRANPASGLQLVEFLNLCQCPVEINVTC